MVTKGVRLPEEIVVTVFLPTYRTLLARRLAAASWSEAAIARVLGVSQAAVSKYLRGKARVEELLAKNRTMVELVDGVAKGFSEGTISPFQALAKVHAAVRAMEDRGPICSLHEASFPALDGLGCDLCVKGSRSYLAEEQEVLASLRLALRQLEGLRGFVDLIPSVGSNLAMAKRRATGFEDVAAVPGRIFEMRGSVRVPSAPEFGASRHVAEVVLALHSLDSNIRAAVNTRFSDAIVGALRSQGHATLEIDPAYEGRSARIRESVKGRPVPTVVYHRGGFGIEPVVYIAGSDPRAVVVSVETLLGILGGRG